MDFTNISIKDRLRLSQIKRWHMVDTTQVQTVADHTCGVMFIAEMLRGILADEFGLYVGCDDLLKASLHHDIPEIVTGDNHNPSTCSPEYLAKKYREKWNTLSLLERTVKLADLLEARLTISRIGRGEYAHEIKGSYDRCIDWSTHHFFDGDQKLEENTLREWGEEFTNMVHDELERPCEYALKY